MRVSCGNSFPTMPTGSTTSLNTHPACQTEDVALAIGWLAREDKIDFDIDEQHDRLFLHVNVYIG